VGARVPLSSRWCTEVLQSSVARLGAKAPIGRFENSIGALKSASGGRRKTGALRNRVDFRRIWKFRNAVSGAFQADHIFNRVDFWADRG